MITKTETAGYDALRNGAALIDLSDRGRILVTGEDRARLLHALTTNHIQQLIPGSGCYAFFLTAQGRILGDAVVLCREDSFLLDTEASEREKLQQHIDKYIIAEDVTLEDATGSWFAVGLEGPQAATLLKNLGAELPEQEFAQTAWDRLVLAKVSATGLPGYRVYGPVEEKADLLEQLAGAGFVAASSEDAETVRIEQGKPRYGTDMQETTLPQETQQAWALHFQKGCYLGQEIVERIRARGHVNKALTRLRVETESVAPGTSVQLDGKEVGTVTSAAYSPSLGAVAVIAMLRVDAAKDGNRLQVGGAPATVVA